MIFYKIADGTEGPDITISGYGTSTFLALLTFRYWGVATYNPLDQTSSKSGTGTAISTNSITTTRANELLIAGVCQSKSSSFSGWGSPFTVRSGIQGTASASYADRIVSSTGTYSTSVTASQSGAWRAHMASFKAVKTWDGGAGTNNWGDANNWNPNGVPASTDVIELTGANTIDINVAAVGMDLYLNNASLILTVKSGQSLTLGGNLAMASGALNTEASFPTVSGTTTLSGGTVGYTAASGSQTVAVKSYVNLTVSGGGTKTLAGTITPSGNLSVNGGTFDLRHTRLTVLRQAGHLPLPTVPHSRLAGQERSHQTTPHTPSEPRARWSMPAPRRVLRHLTAVRTTAISPSVVRASWVRRALPWPRHLRLEAAEASSPPPGQSR